MDDSRKIRKEILKLEKQMQRTPNQQVVLTLAEKYSEIGEPHQAVAVLIEGIQANPESATLKVICARFMLMYQTDEITKAENLVKEVLNSHPDNLMAQQLLEQIHTQVDTMHEVPMPFNFDTSELQKQVTLRFPKGAEPDGDVDRGAQDWEEAESARANPLAEAYRLVTEGALDNALEIVQQVL
ncbi:MAG TPA: tetratricopeptide repeat protein, partial [bacterium]|nr:tetratricopeptide repeat protein [bacterium]